MKNVIDIDSRSVYPSGNLSNFFPYRFIFDGIVCLSMKGLLQSFKFEDFNEQKMICKLSGVKAKIRGTERNEIWKEKQALWWRGKEYKRESPGYQKLLDRIYKALSKNIDFQRTLLSTGCAKLIHTIGWHNVQETILTEEEFCVRLMKIRKKLREGKCRHECKCSCHMKGSTKTCRLPCCEVCEICGRNIQFVFMKKHLKTCFKKKHKK